MKAVVFKGAFDVAVEDVADPRIEQPSDAVIRPDDWATADWASDIIPHLGYGAAVYATLTALDTERRKGMR